MHTDGHRWDCEVRLFFSAGEASGDAYARALLEKVLLLARARPLPNDNDLIERSLRRILGPDFTAESVSDGDSLDIVELVMAIEDEFGIEIPDNELVGIQTSRDLSRFIGSRLKVEWPTEIFVQAIGGRKVREAGAELIADSSDWGAIGIAESLKILPKARRGLAQAKKAMTTGEPGLFVPIDYGFFNIGLAHFAKQLGWKVVYFSPPGAWRKDKQGVDLPKVSDAVITPFSWSAEMLNKMGAKAHWFGHPIKQMIREAESINEKRKTINDREGIAILPGSRKSEIDLLLPVFAKALKAFSESAEFAVASSLDVDALRLKWKALAPEREDSFVSGDTYGVLQRAKAAIVCSGTATLEAALCRCPHIVVYKVSKAVELQARLARFKVPLIAQPNTLLDRMVVSELIQYGATPEAVARELRELLDDEGKRKAQLEAFEELEKILGPDDAIDKSAELIVGMLVK